MPERSYLKPEFPNLNKDARDERLDQFFKNVGVTVHEMGTKASYSVALDLIKMPPFVSFRDAESFFATLAHEFVHATRHPTRLNRDFGRRYWGDEAYAKEELVAEMGSAFLCADLGITPETGEDHAAYLSSWLKVLQQEKRFIFTAAAHAQRAVEHLHSYQPQPSAVAA